MLRKSQEKFERLMGEFATINTYNKDYGNQERRAQEWTNEP